MNEIFGKLGYEPTWRRGDYPAHRPITFTGRQLRELDFKSQDAPVLGDWLRVKRYAIVCARRFTGKTFFAMGAAVAIAGGGTLWGWSAPIPRKVLYVDGELTEGQIQGVYEHVLKGAKHVDPTLVDENFMAYPKLAQTPQTRLYPLETAKGQRDVRRVAREFGAEVIVFDNLKSLTMVADQNSDAKVGPIMEFLLGLKGEGYTVLLVHHSSSKSNPKHPDDPCKGAGDLGDKSDTILYLRRYTKQDDGEARGDLTFHKWRDGQDTTPVRYHLSRETGKWDWSYPGEGAEPDEGGADPNVTEALALFHNDAYTSVAAMAREHSAKPTRKTLVRWLRKGGISDEQRTSTLEARSGVA